MLNAAIDDGIILSNPVMRLGQSMKLVSSATQRQEEIKAMTWELLNAFLNATANTQVGYFHRHYPLFLLLARTGLRLGEAMALEWKDIDFIKGRFE